MKEKTPVPVSGWMGSNSRLSLLHVTACQIAIAAVLALMPTTSLALPPTAIQAYPASDDGMWTMVGKAHDPGRRGDLARTPSMR